MEWEEDGKPSWEFYSLDRILNQGKWKSAMSLYSGYEDSSYE